MYVLTYTIAAFGKQNVSEDAMTTTMFRDLLRQRPFRPFRLVMSSGETYDVRHPEMAWVTHNDIFVGIDAADDGVPVDARICPLLHVTAIEPLPAAGRAG